GDAPDVLRTQFWTYLKSQVSSLKSQVSSLKSQVSSLFIVTDIADDVGDVLVTFLIVGNEGRIIVVIVLDGLIDLDVVLGFRHPRLHLPGVLLGIGLRQRDHLFGLGGLRRGLRRRHGTGAGGLAAGGARRRNRGDRHDLAGIGRNHRVLVEVV